MSLLTLPYQLIGRHCPPAAATRSTSASILHRRYLTDQRDRLSLQVPWKIDRIYQVPSYANGFESATEQKPLSCRARESVSYALGNPEADEQSENWQSGHLDLDVAKAMLSGCLVASVTPSVEPATIGKVILPLRSTEEQLPFDDVELQLGSLTDSELKRKVLDAFLYARHHFTGQACVDSILDIADHWDRGGRGYMVGLLEPAD